MQQPTRIVIAALAITITAAAAPTPAHAGKPPAVLSSLPDDTAVVASVDFKKTLKAPIAADAVDLLRQRAADKLATLQAMGFDLEKDVTKVYVAIAGTGLADADAARLKVVIAEGKLKIDPKQLSAEAKTHEGVTYYTTNGTDFAVVNKRLYVVSDGKMPDLLDVIKGKAKNAAKSPATAALRAALGSISTATEGWLVATMNDADRSKFGAHAGDLQWFAMSGGLRTDSIDVVIRLGMTTAASAKTFADDAGAQVTAAKQGMPAIGLGDLANSLAISTKGVIVSVTASVTKAEIATIAGMASMMMPKTGSPGGTAPPPMPPSKTQTAPGTAPAPTPVSPAPTPAPPVKKTP